jgi:predicted enzyme related to lactoylglutathione lyase
MSIQVKELAFVFYPVTDVARARKFYEGLLGLKVGYQIEYAPGRWWIEYDVAGQALAISNDIPGKTASSVALEVADLEAALTAAKSSGFTMTRDVMEFPPCRMFVVQDSDGNEVTLHRRKPKPDGVEKT